MTIEKIVELQPDESELLYSGRINDGSIEVRQWQQYRWLHLSDESIQSLMQLDQPGQIILANIQALLAVLLFFPEPKTLLNLGLGGASLERYLDSNWSDLKVSSVESNGQVIQLARDYFYLPETVEVIHDTAEHFLENHNGQYDIILCDIFVADNQASCLYEKSFYTNISRCINSSGVMAINILPENEDDVVNVLLPIKDHFGYLYLLEFEDYSNAIIFATKEKIPDMSVLNTRAEELFNKTDLDLRDIPEKLNVLLETV